jgi:hypothetical protein
MSKAAFGFALIVSLSLYLASGERLVALPNSERTYADPLDSDIASAPRIQRLTDQSRTDNRKLVRFRGRLAPTGQDDGSRWLEASYRSVELDLRSMTLQVRGFLAGTRFLTERHFLRSMGGWSTEIADCEAQWSDGSQVCYNLFNVDSDNRLIYRTKYLELLRGAFGTLYSKVFYEYRPDVVMRDGAEPVRLPNQLDTFVRDYCCLRYVPADTRVTYETIGQLPLSAISVVRIFRKGDSWLNVSGNYSSDGHLYEITVDNNSKFGDNSQAAGFGIPEEFPIDRYLLRPEDPFGTTSLTADVSLVVLHYDESYVVRRDAYSTGKPRASTFLVFPQTDEDRQLREIDRTRDFAELFYTRTPRQ